MTFVERCRNDMTIDDINESTMNDPACALSESCDLGRSAMLDSKVEPQPGEGSGDNNCSMPRNKIPHDEGMRRRGAS